MTININGSDRVLMMAKKDIILEAGSQVQYFEMENFERDWKIPLLYFYTVLNGRYIKSGKNRAGHVCPCVLKHKENYDLPEYSYPSFNKKDCILLSMWKTRCNNPVIHLVLYFPGETNCYLMKEKVVPFLHSRVCDLSAEFDEEDVKQ